MSNICYWNQFTDGYENQNRTCGGTYGVPSQQVASGQQIVPAMIPNPSYAYDQVGYGVPGPQVQQAPQCTQRDYDALIQSLYMINTDNQHLRTFLQWANLENGRLQLKLEEQEREKKRKETGHYLEKGKRGQVQLVTCYDNATETGKTLISEAYGDIKVFKVNFIGYTTPRKYLLVWFGDQIVILDRNKVRNGKYIYEQLIVKKIPLNQTIKKNAITEALKEYFLPYLDETNCENVMDIATCAGWDSAWNFRSERCVWIRAFSEPFPVLSKRFNEVKLQKHGIELYFDMLNRISAKEDRMVMMLYPIVGILHSLLDGTPTRLRTVLNCIPSESDDSIWVAACLQVFNRDKLEAIDANMTLTERNQLLASSKDEVLLVNAQVSEYEDAYSKKKKKSNISSLSDLVRGKCSPADGATVKSAIAFISDDVMRGNAMNLFLEPFDEDFMEEFVESHAMEMVLSGVVHFVENHKYDVEQLIRKKRNLADKRLRPLAIAYDILAYFFAGEGITLQDEVQLPEIEELAKLFLDGCDSPEQQVETFIQVVRQGREEFSVYTKGYGGTFREDGVYCTKELVYFPKRVLTGLFERRHELKLMNQVLTHLRATGDLVTDAGSGTTKKLQVGNERVSVYCFKRDLFSRLGDSDFVDIGRRDENA